MEAEYKYCPKCKEDLPLSKFNKNKGKFKNVSSTCAECNKAYLRQHYQNNKEYYLKKKYVARRKIYKWYDSIISQLSCFRCDENHPATLDWHHEFPEDKVETISILRNTRGKKTIINEMKKCIILCANCHRKFHYKTRE